MHCISDKLNIGFFLHEKNAINDSPTYQRESGIWGTEKQQLFLDSILNGFDVPKIYLHDLRSEKGRYKFAVIDGKQRLHTLWQFLDDKLPLASDFRMTDNSAKNPPKGSVKFSKLSEDWRDFFKGKNLDVVYVQDADEDDIEDLFSRLNNGEPLNAAEKRNALGGDACELIRELAKHPFFVERLRFKNTRYQYLEVAAKFLLIEKSEAGGGSPFVDLKKKFLDKLVSANTRLSPAESSGLKKRVSEQLRILNRIFHRKDELLQKQAYPPLYYLFVKLMDREYASATLLSDLRKFLAGFHAMRAIELEKKEDERDPVIIEFGRLMQQGTNDLTSLKQRVSILQRFFLQEHPDIALKDKRREFTAEERIVIYHLAGKQCLGCKKEFSDISEMHADHLHQWVSGGPTSLKNARALCEACNTSQAKKRT